MKLKSLLLGLLFVFGIIHSAAEEQSIALNTEIATPNEDIITYTVKKGDTVYSIAAAHNTTVEEIYRLNPEARNGIKKGNKLQIAKVQYKITGYSEHLIEPKETLFSVSKMYNVTVDNLKNANPGLDAATFQIGKTIRIPKFGIPTILSSSPEKNGNSSSVVEYRVEKGDTLYSISKKYNTTVEAILSDNPLVRDGLKEGMVLQIAEGRRAKETTVADNRKANTTSAQPLISKAVKDDDGVIRIGILLPFLDEKSDLKDKITEYYQGFLLGVKELKEKGYNAEIYTFDIGEENNTKKLESLLGTNEINNLNLIIGGVSNQQIDVISRFSKKTGIKYVIPFGTKNNAVASNPHLFQAINPPSNLLDRVTSSFKDHFKNYNIVFVAERDSDNNKKDFVADLKKVLSKAGISHQTIGSGDNLSNELKEKLNSERPNLLIPTSSSKSSVSQLLAHLKMTDISNVSLFGYPEWQTYTDMYTRFHENDTYLYSIFFLDESQYKVRNVKDQYVQWYNKPLINSYPQFAYLGYDDAIYFMTVIQRYGSNFEAKMSEANIPTLQSATHFERDSDKGGYINKGIYFVHYKTDSSIEKIDCNK